MDMLRFITAGSVDDGKSTLIGRLLFDSKSIMADQLDTISRQSRSGKAGELDLALFTDGLRAEREQGITIDVAYKYFSTPIRKFIIADAPGHVQYTRNMVTGASNADLAIILIDARNGVVEQTRRHTILAWLLGIRHYVVAVNKMDQVEYSQDVFNNIVIDYAATASELRLEDVYYVPISALNGDNIVETSNNMPWHKGPSLLGHLESVEIQRDVNLTDPRFSVQYVIRPQGAAHSDYRGYAGRIMSGVYRTGDPVFVLPVGLETRIKAIEEGGVKVLEAFAGQSVVLQLEDDLDISRGDLIVSGVDYPPLKKDIDMMVCWMDSKPLLPGRMYLFQVNSHVSRAMATGIAYRLDVNTLERHPNPGQASLNDIVKASLRFASPLPLDSYKELKVNGCGILIDETSHATVGACMIE